MRDAGRALDEDLRLGRLVRWGLSGAGLLASVTAVGQASAKDEQSEFAQVRKATARYHNEAKAVAAGYTRSDFCVPGMGYHYVNEDCSGLRSTH